MAGLNARQTRFVDEYIRGGNATKAAKLAGYSERTARQMGSENLSKPDIIAEIDARRVLIAKGELLASEATPWATFDWVLTQLRRVYETAVEARPMYDASGAQVGYTVNLAAANKSLELIAKHLGMFVERKVISGDVGIVFDMRFGDGLRTVNGDPAPVVIDQVGEAHRAETD